MNLDFLILCIYCFLNLLQYQPVSPRFFRNLRRSNNSAMSTKITDVGFVTKNVVERPQTLLNENNLKSRTKVINRAKSQQQKKISLKVTSRTVRAKTKRVRYKTKYEYRNSKTTIKSTNAKWNEPVDMEYGSNDSTKKPQSYQKYTKRKSEVVRIKGFVPSIYIKHTKESINKLQFLQHITTKPGKTALITIKAPKTTQRSFHHRHYYRKLGSANTTLTSTNKPTDVMNSILLQQAKPKPVLSDEEYVFDIWPTAVPLKSQLSTIMITYTTVTTTTTQELTLSTLFGNKNTTRGQNYDKVRQSIINDILGLDYDDLTRPMIQTVEGDKTKVKGVPNFLENAQAEPVEIFVPKVVAMTQKKRYRTRKTHQTWKFVEDNVENEFLVNDAGNYPEILRQPDTTKKKGKKKTTKTRKIKLDNYTYCFECGLRQEQVPYSGNCYDLFSEDPTSKSLKIQELIKKKCETNVRGCVKRFTDVDSPYFELGCRSWPPVKGMSFGSERFFALEKMLVMEKEGCVMSPHAVLTAYSPGVSLWVRFGVCVCQGNYCNAQFGLTAASPCIIIVLVAISLNWYTNPFLRMYVFRSV